MNFQSNHWALLDLQYVLLEDGLRIIATTDVPCHLYARMTTTKPIKRKVGSRRRGTVIQGEVRYCFVVYEDNEQIESGDTLTHTWNKTPWPICETRWFYFIGSQGGAASVSETCIFSFHFQGVPSPTTVFAYPNAIPSVSAHAQGISWPACRVSPFQLLKVDYGVPPWQWCQRSHAHFSIQYHIWRTWLFFSLAPYDPDLTIVPGTVKLRLWPNFNTDVNGIYITPSAFIYWPVTLAHWLPQNSVTTSYAYLEGSAVLPGAYREWVFNSAGEDFLKSHLGGQIVFCIMQHFDFLNTPASGYRTWGFFSPDYLPEHAPQLVFTAY